MTERKPLGGVREEFGRFRPPEECRRRQYPKQQLGRPRRQRQRQRQKQTKPTEQPRESPDVVGSGVDEGGTATKPGGNGE